MYYDDEGRRFNVLSGLLFGTLLGAGIALLAGPRKRFATVLPGAPGRVRRARPSGRKTARRARPRRSLRAKVFEAVAASMVDALKRSRPAGQPGE